MIAKACVLAIEVCSKITWYKSSNRW